jgi:hypothetical protein
MITKNFGQKFNIGIKKLNLMQIHIDEKLNKSHAEKIKAKEFLTCIIVHNNF